MTEWWIRPAPRERPGCRLLCLPHAGAGPSVFFDWPTLLSPNIEVCAAQLPGHGTRTNEPAYDDARALAGALCDALVPLLDDVPLAVFGHSMGALVGLELARELRRRGNASVRWMFASAYAAPQVVWQGQALHALPAAELLAGLSTWYPTDTPEEQQLLAELLPVLRADFALCERYAYVDEPPFDFPISALGGMSDPEVSKADLAAWRAQTTGPFQARMMPGDHMYYRHGAARLLRVIDKELAALTRE